MAKRKRQRKSGTCAVKNEENGRDDVVGGGEDRLSDLPESILTDILSRLPTRDAVRTCVLSKQWEKKWTSIYNLEFKDVQFRGHGPSRKDRFSNFVDRVLMQCSSTTLQSFRLTCTSSPTDNYDPDRINSWISTALRRNTQFLLIDTCSQSTLLPRATYYRDSRLKRNGLKELIILSMLTVRVPDDALFSNLTKLEFNHVVLLGNSNDDVFIGGGPVAENGGGQLVVLKLPFLEYLSMFYCEWKNVIAANFNAPRLRSFNMTMRTQNYNFSNEELLEGLDFTVYGGSNLTHIKVAGNLSEDFSFLPSSQIQNASIKLVTNPPNWIDTGNRISASLKRMTNLVFLELSGESLMALHYAAKSGIGLPLFGRLIHLKLHTTDFWCTAGGTVVAIMRQTPILQTLTVETVTEIEKDLERHNDIEGDEIIPECFHSHLKVASFVSPINCMKKEKDANLIKFILENARALQQLKIINPPKRRTIPLTKIRKLLLSFPRASSAAKIMFI